MKRRTEHRPGDHEALGTLPAKPDLPGDPGDPDVLAPSAAVL